MKKQESPYNYPNFKAEYYNLPTFQGPKPGGEAPDFTAYTPDGKPISFYSLLHKPTVLEAGSITCPVYTGKIKSMHILAAKYPSINFLVLYVREAHPGGSIPAHTSLSYKQRCAQNLQKKLGENRLIIVDDLNGTAHKTYGLFPDMVYFINTDGTILYRAQWNQPDELDTVLHAFTAGTPLPIRESTHFNWRNINWFALWRAGYSAIFDFIKGLPSRMYTQWKQKK